MHATEVTDDITRRTTMKRPIALASLALLAAVALSAPANAQSCAQGNGYGNQYYGNGNPNWNSNRFNNNNFNNRFNANANGYGYGYGNRDRFGNAFNRFGNIDNTQDRLQQRITAGINSGRLTQSESARLQAKFSQIATLEANLRASGNRLSMGERQRLISQLNRLNSDVTRQMNDFDGRMANGGRYGWNRY